jgi:hypothetical protein
MKINRPLEGARGDRPGPGGGAPSRELMLLQHVAPPGEVGRRLFGFWRSRARECGLFAVRQEGKGGVNADRRLDVKQGWRRFLMYVELTRNYWRVYLMTGATTHRNPLLEDLLPAVLYINMVSLLDEALEVYIDVQDIEVPRGYRNTLKDKIDLLAGAGAVINADTLHDIRKKRNTLAHELTGQITWEVLDTDRSEVESTLRELSLVDASPEYEFFFERSGAKKSDDPEVAFVQDYQYGLKEGDVIVVDVSWTREFK